jgi:short-subunit dehydrogenase
MPRKTALITGASSGLGVEFARIAAREGYDLFLVARRMPELRSLASELGKAHGITAFPMAFDLADPAAPAQIFESVQREVKARDLAIEVLVNNAGYASNGPFLDLPLAGEVGMVEVNVSALVQLTWLFGREMRARKAGRILNIASTAGFQAGPGMATYYATKAFVLSFSEALADELAGSGVTVTAHCPGATATGFAARAGSERSALFQKKKPASADEVARHGWAAMEAGKPLAVHGAMNRLGAFSVRFAPRSVARSIAAALNRTT